MEILPSEYQHIDLDRNEKIFVRNIMSNEQYAARRASSPSRSGESG